MLIYVFHIFHISRSVCLQDYASGCMAVYQYTEIEISVFCSSIHKTPGFSRFNCDVYIENPGWTTNKKYQSINRSILDVKLVDLSFLMMSVVDLEVVRLNPPLGTNYFNFMGKFIKKSGKMLKTNPLLMDFNPFSKNPGSAPVMWLKWH